MLCANLHINIDIDLLERLSLKWLDGSLDTTKNALHTSPWRASRRRRTLTTALVTTVSTYRSAACCMAPPDRRSSSFTIHTIWSTNAGSTYTSRSRKCDNDERSWCKRCNNIVSCEFLWIHRPYIQLNVHYCVLFSSRVRVRIGVRIRFIVWLVSGYAHVFVLLSFVIATLPHRPPVYNSSTVSLPTSLLCTFSCRSSEVPGRLLHTSVGSCLSSNITLS